MSRATRLMAGLILVVVPTIELGGSFLLSALIDRDSGYMTNALRQNFFRAGHAHAGVLLLLSLLYYIFLDRTALAASVKQTACVALFVGILAQSGGFFLHMALGKPKRGSIGTTVTIAGAVMLACAVIALVYGLITTP